MGHERGLKVSKDSNSKDAKLFGKYHEVVLLLLAFFMTTICGGLLGYYFQNRSWQQQHQVRLLESERLAAEEVFSEVSRLMDTRMYKMRKVFWGIQGEMGKAEMEIRWSDYREILDEWNINLNTNLALLHRYFGRGAREIFEN